MNYRGTVRGGVVVLDPGANLAEGTVVRAETDSWESLYRKEPLGAPEHDPAYNMGELAGPAGILDLSLDADHYLYGHPKVSDGR